MLEDIAILTGGKAVFKDLEVDLENMELDELGSASKITITSEDTTIIKGKGAEGDVVARISQIRRDIDNSTSDYDREKLQERLAKLAGGVAQINVGAATEVELKEKKARVEDALHATRAAVEDGIVPGGGVALFRARNALDAINLNKEEKFGKDVVMKALTQPIRTIAENAGKEGSIIIRTIEKEKGSFGYDAARGEFGDMFAFGILDPTKVTKSALENGASVSALLLTTDCIITDLPKKEDDNEAPPPDMGGMY